MLKKISELKDCYGDDEKQFKKLTSILRPAVNGFEISSRDIAISSSKEAVQRAQKIKEDILITIGKLKQEIQNIPKKNKARGRGLPYVDLRKYEYEISKTISLYLGASHILSEMELLAIVRNLRESMETDDGVILRIREETRHQKEETVGKNV